MIIVGKVSTKIYFQENEVMPWLHEALQFAMNIIWPLDDIDHTLSLFKTWAIFYLLDMLG